MTRIRQKVQQINFLHPKSLNFYVIFLPSCPSLGAKKIFNPFSSWSRNFHRLRMKKKLTCDEIFCTKIENFSMHFILYLLKHLARVEYVYFMGNLLFRRKEFLFRIIFKQWWTFQEMYKIFWYMTGFLTNF